MIASVLFYWLYPLARYLSSGKSSEITKPGISGSSITGKQACEGPDVPPSSSMKGGKQEYAQEDQGNPSTTINGEQPKTGLQGRLETAEKMQSVGTGDERLLDHWDLPLQHTQAKTHLHHQVFDLNQNEVKPAQTSSSAQRPDALRKDTSTQAITEGRTVPVESLTPAGLEEPDVPEVQAPFPMRERWDEYTEIMWGRTEKCVLDLRSLLSDGQNHSADERQKETEPEESWGPQTCWHIPTGPGLADVTHCPLLEFPSMSYYPPLQHTEPLEEITKPGISGSSITGKQACEGPDVPPSSSMKGGKQEYAQEDQGNPSTTINGEQPKTGLQGRLETAEKMQSVGTGDERLLDHWDLPLQHTQAKTHLHHQVFDLNQKEVKPAQTSSSAQRPDALREDTSTQAITEGRTVPVESLTPAGLEEPDVPEVQAPFPMRERWDEYTEIMWGRTEKCVLDLRSLLSDGQNHSADERQEETEPEESWGPQTCWHIPTGPGLADVTHCPLLEFPSMSYYPPLQHTEPLEVVWRAWEEVNAGQTTAVDPVQSAPFNFSVMSYNILSQDLLEAHQELYSHCPLEVLDWSNRYPLLQQEILKWMPDIMCLQEVQENHYEEELRPFLAEIGYKCVYKRRTGTKTDGCATCYRGDHFSEVSATSLEFFRPESELLDRDNVGIALLLQPILPLGSSEGPIKAPSCICVANTHLLFNPRRGDVKLAQLAIMLAEIHALVKASKSRGQRCNAILCGDFNAVPSMPLYQLITSGRLHYHGLPAWMVSGVEDQSYKANPYTLYAPLWPSSLGVTGMCQYTPSQDEQDEHHNNKDGKLQYSHGFLLRLRLCQAARVRPADLVFIPAVTDNTPVNSQRNFPHAQSMGPTICHGLGLSSVYQHVLPGLGQPEVTTLHSEAGATVDYIFYTPRRDPPSDDPKGFGSLLGGGLELTGYLSLLSEEDLWSMAGLPNYHFPSDHLSLLARFKAW